MWPLALAAAALALIYRRVRGSFGKQPVRPGRMGLRIALLIAAGASFALAPPRSAALLVVQGMSAAAGAALALCSARRTRYVRHDGRIHYIPHSLAGIAIVLMVCARFMYRLSEGGLSEGGLAQGGLSAGAPAQGAAPQGAAFAAMQSPVTAGLIFLMIGYYLCYYSRVLWKSRHLEAKDLEPAADGVAGSPIA